MKRASAIVVLVASLAGSARGLAQPDLSGEWTLVSATTNRTRDGDTGEQRTKSYVSDFSAFNCGRACRIRHKGSTLIIENAQLKDGATATGPTVTIVIDGRPHPVVDSVTIGNTIDAVGRWEAGKLLITSMLGAVPLGQTISLEQNQLVVVKSFATSDTKLTLRYTKK